MVNVAGQGTLQGRKSRSLAATGIFIATTFDQ
jgi:hypothetical protein